MRTQGERLKGFTLFLNSQKTSVYWQMAVLLDDDCGKKCTHMIKQ